VRLVQTLVVRDEVDVVEAQIAYHLAAGVDFVLATDHESRDGTAEILEAFEAAGRLRLIREHGAMRDGPWRTRMARLAASEHGADWVLNTDADEFWVPRRGTLKESLAAVPPDYGVIWAVSRHFVPRPSRGEPFSERMTARFAAPAALNSPKSVYRPHGKAAHRGDPAIEVRYGSHRVATGLAPLPHWHPADVLHFPYRSIEQYERKTVRRAHSDSRLSQYVMGLQAREQGRVQEVFDGMVVDDATLARGLEEGSLALDTRLRDALRALRRPGGERSPSGEFRLDPPPPFPAADAAPLDAAVDAAVFRDAEVVRLLRFATDLNARLDAFERREAKGR
jgi:hypothetical protein